jgi:hypothetical protein
MKKKHSWANAIPKTRREKDIIRLTKNPGELKRMTDLLSSAQKVVDSFRKSEDEKFKTVEEIVAFVSLHISDEVPKREVLIEELNKMRERYEERLLSGEGISQSASI